ncbi:MAG: viologen exporter family transport system ATP-binding protein [Abditibacteriota bacterium]|nr:viologen exporter family transport system ATP-binding protein [Abditibacteriota bacterium]
MPHVIQASSPRHHHTGSRTATLKESLRLWQSASTESRRCATLWPVAVIEVSHLTRRFTTHLKQPGLRGALRGLVKREYQTKTAVDDVSFSIERGEFVGFLGPNGAGKTTTLKMLSGVLHPTSGEARVLGFVPWQRKPEFQKRFSLVLGQKNQLWWDLPAYDSFELNRDIYDIEPSTFKAKVEELAELLEIQKLLNVPVRKLSLGERMKCEVAASLLHSPDVLFLDEPTIGLDVVSQVRLREFLRDYNERTGLTVILTSHYMADIQALCKRVVVIDGGRAVFDGALRDLVAQGADQRTIRFHLQRELSPEERLHLEALDESATLNGRELELTVAHNQVPQRVAQLLALLPVEGLAVEDVAVENIIRELFSKADDGRTLVTGNHDNATQI